MSIGGGISALTPTVKIYEKPWQEEINYEDDPYYGQGTVAYRTKDHVPANHIGLIGALQALSPKQLQYRLSQYKQMFEQDPKLRRAILTQTLEGFINLFLSYNMFISVFSQNNFYLASDLSFVQKAGKIFFKKSKDFCTLGTIAYGNYYN